MYRQFKEIAFKRSTLAVIEQANEIIEEYEAQGFILTLRQLYYQFVAKALIENSERSYKNLGAIVADARIAGLMSWTAIEDRGRNCTVYGFEEDEQEVVSGLEYGLSYDFWARQENYVEIWVEKEALFSVIERTAQKWHVPHMACKGYLSVSEAYRAGQRFAEKAADGKNCFLLHLGDHDPSGIDMTRDNGARLDLFAGDGIVEVRRVALNMPQVEAHKPPPNPAKITDSRAEEYIRRFGTKSWELDALKPQVIDKLLTKEISQLIDLDVWKETREEQDGKRFYLGEVYSRWDEIKELIDNLNAE